MNDKIKGKKRNEGPKDLYPQVCEFQCLKWKYTATLLTLTEFTFEVVSQCVPAWYLEKQSG